ncbi:IctB family putative bicarbonate transporter [Calothrix sp. 336/3]|uniref:IctB family putative bicarbonate transporter n=1 Tax=Calothrix sp. 336/3 TaxID=1337936 RepID=UPI0004E2B191|nr:IctB family putative bicarbonate transporter [Calothrix sp. 336/3]AKG22001.1 polymerase [Calothrix sp. 336/3]
MNLVWQRFTLSDLPLKDYVNGSYLHRFVGFLSPWRQTSWLLQWGDAIATMLVSLVFVLAPFTVTKTTVLGLFIVACSAFWLLLTVSDDTTDGNHHFVTPIHLLVLLYWGICVIATAASEEKKAALEGLINFSLYFILFALCARILRSPSIRSWMLTLYLHISLFVSIYAVRQKFFGAAQLATWVDPESPLSKNTRVYSYLGNPNLLAGYILPALILSLVAIFAWRGLAPKALAFTMFVVNAACLRFADSRGSYIGLAIAAVVLVLLLRYWYASSLPLFWRRWLVPIILGIFIALFLVAFGASETFRLRIVSIFAGREDSSNNFRINVWTSAIKMIQHYPIFGIGPGHDTFNLVYPRYQAPKYTALSAYSIFLETAVETGLIGLLSFLWLLIVIFNTGWQRLQQLRDIKSQDGLWLIGAIAALVAMLGHGLVDTVWYRPVINSVWWLIVGLIASYYQLPNTSSQLSDSNK